MPGLNPRSRTTRPYFPGYLFVRVKLAEVGQTAFSWMPYSQGLVSFDDTPAEVPDALVQAIRKRVDEVPCILPAVEARSARENA